MSFDHPFGLDIPLYTLGVKNPCLYNGKEWQDGINQYDYGARLYDPVIGRFGTQDRFAEKYSDMTPYQYASLDPIKNIDVNGDSTWTTTREVRDGKNVTVYQTTHITGKVLKTGTGSVSAKSLAGSLNKRLNAQSSSGGPVKNEMGGVTTTVYNIEANYEAVTSMDQVGGSDHLVVMVDDVTGMADPALGGGPAAGLAAVGGKIAYVEKWK